jgi:competence protein ComEC
VAVVPVGYPNRFGHPHADVLARLSALRLLRTDRHGAVHVKVTRSGIEAIGERQRRRRYWHDG